MTGCKERMARNRSERKCEGGRTLEEGESKQGREKRERGEEDREGRERRGEIL